MPPVPRQRPEHQPRRRRRTRTALRIQVQAPHALRTQLPPYLALHQRLHQFHPEVQPQQTRHSTRALQPHRRYPEYALELLVTLLHERLILVLRQRLSHPEGLVVGHQREQPVAQGIRRHRRPILVKMQPIRPGLQPAVLRVRPRPSRAYLTKAFFDIRFDADAQPALGPLPPQHLLACPQGHGVGAHRPPAWRLQRLQRGPGPLQPRLPLGTVLVTLLRATVPQDPVALRRPLRGFDPVVDDVRPGLPPRVRLTADLTPGRRPFVQVAPEPTGLRA